MIRVGNVSFKGTKEGLANPTRIPKDNFADHYIIAAGTKRKSSFLVVDTNGFLRRASVEKAWDHRNNTDRDIKREIRVLASYFDEPPIPEEEMSLTVDLVTFGEYKTVAGVRFQGTRDGKLEESEIPNPPDHKNHYLYPADTKGESSYPVVDGEGYLRRGNVESAWELGGRGGVDGEELDRRLKKLGKEFENNPLPNDAYQTMNLKISTTTFESNTFAEYEYSVGDWVYREWSGSKVYGKIRDRTKDSFTVDGNTISGDEGENVYKMEEYDTEDGEFTGQMIAVPESGVYSWEGPSQDNSLAIEEDLAMTAEAIEADDEVDFDFRPSSVGGGFNRFGVRENTNEEGNLQSVDVIFEAMEPGPPEDRNGVRITEEFLREVADKNYQTNPPHLADHERSDSFAKVGDVQEVWFSDRRGKLMVMARVPNTGTRTHDEAIKRYTHEPPSWREGSVGFGRQYDAIENDDGEPELVDASLREFSVVNFPGGYDEGGL